MKSLVVLAFTVAAAGTASAHPCGHGFVIGTEGPFCPQRGGGYWMPSLHLDFAAVAQSIVLPADSVSTSGLAPGTIDASGASFRFHSGVHRFHFGGELILSWFDANARVPSDVMRAATQPDDAGRGADVSFIGGYRRTAGPLMYGLETALGIRNLWRRGAGEDEFAAQGIVEARATGGVWLSPFVSLNAQLGTSLLRRDEHTAMLMLGISVFPWDGLR